MSTFSTSYETLEKKILFSFCDNNKTISFSLSSRAQQRENDVPNEEKMQKNTRILLGGVLQFLSFFICFFGIY